MRLTLRREELAELSATQLEAVVGAAWPTRDCIRPIETIGGTCVWYITLNGC